MRLWDRQCCWDCRTPKDYPTVHRTVGWELLAFLVGLMGIPMECPMCQQGTWDVLSGQGMLKANLDMSEADGRGGGVAGFLTKATYMDFGLRGILI